MEPSPNNNLKGYRFISTKHTASYLPNNLSSASSNYFAFASNTEGAPKAMIYEKSFIEKGDSVQPSNIFQWKDGSECMSLSYATVYDKQYLVLGLVKSCLVCNPNGSR